MPPPRGAGRKGTCPYLNLLVFAESGSHNLDAPYLARRRCRGKSASSNTYGAGAPFRFGGERRLHKEQIVATHTQTRKDFTQLWAARMRKTLLLLVWIDSSSCSGAQEATVILELDEGRCLLGVPPFLRRMGLLLYAQGVTHR